MDIMFNKEGNRNYEWLMLLNVNSRRLYSEEINVGHRKFEQYIEGEEPFHSQNPRALKSAVEILKALHRLIPKIKERFILIRADSEKDFYSQRIIEFLHEQGISISAVPLFNGHSQHTAFAIIDRAIRTIRDKVVEECGKNSQENQPSVQYAVQDMIEKRRGLIPNMVAEVVEAYNNIPHSTLTIIFGKPTRPIDVTSDMIKIIPHKTEKLNDDVKQ
jgi:hypothetical protein